MCVTVCCVYLLYVYCFVYCIVYCCVDLLIWFGPVRDHALVEVLDAGEDLLEEPAVILLAVYEYLLL